MQTKEEKICSFTQKGTRLQLVKICPERPKDAICMGGKFYINNKEIPYVKYSQLTQIKYQVRLNRKIISNSISEYQERKVFATYCQNIVLQLKIY